MIQSDNTIDPDKIVTERGKIQNDNAIGTAKLFNFDAYFSALADIISSESTDTPLTIGIFGDWGSGKTSLMSTIKTELERNDTSGGGALGVKCVWFNAWEQSFGQGGMLTTGPSLLYHIYKELDEELKKREGMAAKAKKMGWKGVRVVFDVLLRRGGNITLGEVEDGLKDETIYPASLADIFHDAIKKYIKLTGCGRVVVFIDDMDRCLPESAVEVLETIKLFLNAEHCIFVLGVDRKVITESIRVRYKDFARSSEGAESPITGDDYLEKIIQLSFQLPPIRTKDIEGFITGLDLPTFYKPYIKMISKGIEQNPRKVKRFLNNLELQRTLAYKIKDIKTIMVDETKGIFYGALLIEWAIINSYYPPPIRNDILREPILLAEMHEYVKRGNELLFSWKDIPEDDEENKKLKAYLMEDHDIDWVENSQISRPDDKTIRLVKDKNSAEITIEIDDETKKATIYRGYDKIHDLEVSDENGKLNIYVGVPVELKNFMKEPEVWIENLEKLIRAFPIKKLPKVDDVDRVIYLSQATESQPSEPSAEEIQAPKSPAEEIQPSEPSAEETKAEKVLTRNEVLEYIKHKKDLTGANMSNAPLKGIDFSDVDNMREVNMSGAYLSKVTLNKVDLSGANLSGADLIGATLMEADLRNVNLSKAKLRQANLSDANLSGTDLSGADLSGADLSGAKLAGASLRDVNLSKAKLRKADLSGANLSGADLSDANLVKANLRRARMDSCTLKNTDLRFCNIWYAQMETVDLSGADLYSAEFYSSNMRGANFENAKLKNTSLNSANLSGAKFNGAEFSNSNLDNAMLDGANFVGADLDSSTRIYSLKKARWENAKFEPWVEEELKKST